MDKSIKIVWIRSNQLINKIQSHNFQVKVLESITNQSPITINRKSGKPTCNQPTIEFSVTHTQTDWLIGISNQQSIGIDIENSQRKIPTNVFNRGNKNRIDLPKLSNLERVLKWTQFEADAKLKGTGIRFPIPLHFASHLRTFFGNRCWCRWHCRIILNLLSLFI